MFYQQLLLNSKLCKDLSAHLGSIYFSVANCNDCLPGEFNRKEFFVWLLLGLKRSQENRSEKVTSVGHRQMFCGLAVKELLV